MIVASKDKSSSCPDAAPPASLPVSSGTYWPDLDLSCERGASGMGFFSKLARSVLRHIRVASKQELKQRIMAAMDKFNRHPVVHTWSYKLDQAA
jgi:hypothetical protein